MNELNEFQKQLAIEVTKSVLSQRDVVGIMFNEDDGSDVVSSLISNLTLSIDYNLTHNDEDDDDIEELEDVPEDTQSPSNESYSRQLKHAKSDPAYDEEQNEVTEDGINEDGDDSIIESPEDRGSEDTETRTGTVPPNFKKFILHRNNK